MSEQLSMRTAAFIYGVVIPIIILTSWKNQIMIMFWLFLVFIISAFYLWNDFKGGKLR